MSRPLEAYRVPLHTAPTDLVLSGNEAPGATLSPIDLGAEALGRYPSTDRLRGALARGWGIAPDQVLVTAGADDALQRVFRATCGPERPAVLPVPTFSMMARFAAWAGAEVREVPWDPAGAWPEAEVRAAAEGAGLIVAVTPNNPTGQTIPTAAIRRVARQCSDAVVVVDLAYADFADDDPTQALLDLPNVVICRTLSKAWGLAGLRVGYALGPAPLLERLAAAGLPYPCSAASLALAEQALTDTDRVDGLVARVRTHRDRLAQRLRARGVAVAPSQGNFVLARSPRARWLHDGLAGLGIAVRRFDDDPALADAVRITVPDRPAAVDRLLDAADTVLAPEALLLDLDGVLADVRGSYRAALRQTVTALGGAATDADIEAMKAHGNANNDWIVAQRLLAASGRDVPLSTVTERFQALLDGGLWRQERALLQPASLPDLPLAIVTGRPRAEAERFLDAHGFHERVQVLVAMEDGPPKPSPVPVRLALERLGVTRAWMVGDTPDDLVAARAAGVVPLGVVAPGEASSDVLTRAGAARVYPDLATLLADGGMPCVA